MKKTVLKAAGCALALGLIAAPAINASASTHVHKSETCKHVTKVKDVRYISKKITEKEAAKVESKKLNVLLTKKVSTVDKKVQALTKKVDAFYTAPETKKAEMGVYRSTLGKLKAYSHQLTSYQKQLNAITKKNKAATVTLSNVTTKITSLQDAIKAEITKVQDLHKNFKPAPMKSEDHKGDQDKNDDAQDK
jgi:predicted  nucleic acid-binding Zn-ribbon protein